jgi:hypothetical protein
VDAEASLLLPSEEGFGIVQAAHHVVKEFAHIYLL